jgi:hypothetical protein
MTEQPPDFTGTAEPGQQHPASQRLERLLRSLNRLKSDISDVEARHHRFGSELSSLCDTVIADLNSLNSQNSAGQQADRDNLNVNLDKETAMPELVPTAKHNTNPILWAIDKAGSHLITGLDKTGDGIIFILGKLFTNRISKAESGTPAEADLSNS